METESATLGARLEQAVRELVDWTAAVDDGAAAMDAVADQMDEIIRAGQNGGGGVNNEDDDNEDDGDGNEDQQHGERKGKILVKGLLEVWGEQRAVRTTAYQNLDAHERYGRDNHYIGFRRHYHESLYGDDQPLPDARRWFTADGRPVLRQQPVTGGDKDDDVDGNGNGNDDDDDDDVVLDREKISFKCPLSLQIMEEPYSNTKCRHSFERSSIEAFIGRRGRVPCPQTGCSQVRRVGG
jgi:hypothetical protein